MRKVVPRVTDSGRSSASTAPRSASGGRCTKTRSLEPPVGSGSTESVMTSLRKSDFMNGVRRSKTGRLSRVARGSASQDWRFPRPRVGPYCARKTATAGETGITGSLAPCLLRLKPENVARLARELGISTGTVSRALNGKPDVNAATRERVLEAARRVDAIGRVAGQDVDVHVARRHLAPGRTDPDLRLLKVGARKAHGVQHGAAGGPLRAVEDERGMRTF